MGIPMFGDQGFCAGEILSAIYTSTLDRRRVNDFRVDAHSVFKKAQLLKPFELFIRAGWERAEPVQRRAPVAIQANMLEHWRGVGLRAQAIFLADGREDGLRKP